MSTTAIKWRKFSPIEREHPIYELVHNDAIIFDVTMDDDGKLRIAFHDGASGHVFDLDVIERLIADVKVRLEEDKASDD
jgi:hypothetical protein